MPRRTIVSSHVGARLLVVAGCPSLRSPALIFDALQVYVPLFRAIAWNSNRPRADEVEMAFDPHSRARLYRLHPPDRAGIDGRLDVLVGPIASLSIRVLRHDALRILLLGFGSATRPRDLLRRSEVLDSAG